MEVWWCLVCLYVSKKSMEFAQVVLQGLGQGFMSTIFPAVAWGPDVVPRLWCFGGKIELRTRWTKGILHLGIAKEEMKLSRCPNFQDPSVTSTNSKLWLNWSKSSTSSTAAPIPGGHRDDHVDLGLWRRLTDLGMAPLIEIVTSGFVLWYPQILWPIVIFPIQGADCGYTLDTYIEKMCKIKTSTIWVIDSHGLAHALAEWISQF